MDKDCVIISCLFGDAFQRVYPAVPGFRSLFFTNNPTLEAEIAAKGWDYRYVAHLPLSDDCRASSLQAKYVKFLQFSRDFEDVRPGHRVIYADHKFQLDAGLIKFMLDLVQSDKCVLIRNTPREKLSIQDEIDEALLQPRYAQTMPATVTWLENAIAAEGVSMQTRIMNTGLILYQNIAQVQGLLDEVYATVVRLQQPECQIIWACLAQKYARYIQRVDWDLLNPKWAAPQ